MTTTAPALSPVDAFAQHLVCFARDSRCYDPETLAIAVGAKRKAVGKYLQTLSTSDRIACYAELEQFAIRHRLTWTGQHYAPALNDRELEDYLDREQNWPSLNHFIETRYAVDCMSHKHKVRLWCKAKELGADWDKEGRKFIERK
jgi:hypothetical protein